MTDTETTFRTSFSTSRTPAAKDKLHLRIDPGDDGSPLATGRRSLLHAFGQWGGRLRTPSRAPVAERRRSPRQHVECLAWIGWKTWRRFEMNNALVVDISRGGAGVFTDSPPPTDCGIWLFLETPARNAVVRGQVLDVRATGQGQCMVRVRFSEPCPYVFFEAAVCGQHAVDPKARRTAMAVGAAMG
jgi:hypothetical protein